MTDNHGEIFREEAYELLYDMEGALLELEEFPEDQELIGRIFRAMHTIKGSGAMFGFDEIAAFTHEIETVFDLVRNKKMAVTKELIDLTLLARDRIKNMLDSPEGSAGNVESGEIIASLKNLISDEWRAGEARSAANAESAAKRQTDVSGENTTYRIQFRPAPNLLMNGTNPLLLFDELRRIGTCTVIAYTDGIPPLEEIDPELCYTHWDVILSAALDLNAVKDVFIFVEDDCDLRITVIGEPGTEIGHKKIGEILVDRGDLSHEELMKALDRQKRLGDVLIESGLVGPRQVESALVEQRHLDEIREKRQTVETVASIRVPSERLDKLVNLVGELVTVQARLSQTASDRNDAVILSIAEEVERLTGELRDNTMGIRMVPIGTTFGKFKRLVRDLSQELGKEIDLLTEGGETELDKTVIERLNDPLVHLIRNSIDHGIGAPEVRLNQGKARQGKIRLSAIHSGSNVLIQIKDDGRGLDPDEIRAKAVEQGLISSGAEMSEKEVFSLILLPGFSTAKQITNVSGRGVGMDVVKRAIDSLRGAVEISSRKGEGTTITLTLPLTLAIIDGLLVRIAEDHFVLPLSFVKECVELSLDDISRAHGRHIANVRGRTVPYIRLRELFGIFGERPAIEQIVICEHEEWMMGFVVDSVIGDHQTVIKNLSEFYRDVEGISGATIQGDGTLALILDVPKLIHTAEVEEVNAL